MSHDAESIRNCGRYCKMAICNPTNSLTGIERVQELVRRCWQMALMYPQEQPKVELMTRKGLVASNKYHVFRRQDNITAQQ
jgi:hypothetical protein